MGASRGSGAITLGLGLGLLASAPAAAHAQSAPPYDPAIEVQLFEYAAGPKTFFTVTDGDVAPKRQLSADVLFTFLTDPMTVYNVSDDGMTLETERTQVVKDMFAGALVGAYGLTDRLELDATLPMVFTMRGDGINPDTASASSGLKVTGLGDLRVEAKYRLWQGAGVKLAAGGGVTVPSSVGTGGSDYLGDDLPSARGRFAAQWTTRDNKFSVGSNAGVILRKPREIYATTVGPQVFWGVGAAYRITDRLSVVGEAFGRTGVPDFDLDASPLEAGGGMRIVASSSIQIVAGGGAGLVKGIGSPGARMFLSVGYLPGSGERAKTGTPVAGTRVADRNDRDGDKRDNAADKCPDKPEDIDGFDDDDGCPELDNDGDKLADIDDKCPFDAEDGAQPYPADGCPGTKRDSDGDGLMDAADKCPTEEEDGDGFEDADGCPEAGDGCPVIAAGGPVRLDGDTLRVEAVPGVDRKGLTPAGAAIVDQMAAVMVAHPEVTKWLVAVAAPTQRDAEQQAAWIRARLAAKGVAADRIQVLAATGPAKVGAVAREKTELDPATRACPK